MTLGLEGRGLKIALKAVLIEEAELGASFDDVGIVFGEMDLSNRSLCDSGELFGLAEKGQGAVGKISRGPDMQIGFGYLLGFNKSFYPYSTMN